MGESIDFDERFLQAVTEMLNELYTNPVQPFERLNDLALTEADFGVIEERLHEEFGEFGSCMPVDLNWSVRQYCDFLAATYVRNRL